MDSDPFRSDQKHTDRTPESPLNQALLAHWSSLAADDHLPDYAALDLLDIAAHLPWVFHIDVLPEEDDFLIRMMGERLTKLLHQEFTGCRLSEIGAAEARMRHLYTMTMTERRPVLCNGRFDATAPLGFLPAEGYILPFADGQGTIVRLLHGVQIKNSDGTWMH